MLTDGRDEAKSRFSRFYGPPANYTETKEGNHIVRSLRLLVYTSVTPLLFPL